MTTKLNPTQRALARIGGRNPAADIFVGNDEWAKRFPTVRSRSVAISNVYLTHSAFGKNAAGALFREYSSRGMFDKKYLSELYVHQPSDIFTLELMHSLRDKEGQQTFSLENLFALEQARYLGEARAPLFSDSAWLLRSDITLSVIPAATLLRWSEQVEDVDDAMLAQAEIQRRILIKQDVEVLKGKVTLDLLVDRLNLAIKNNPTGNATKYYLKLILSRSARKNSLRVVIKETIESMLYNSRIGAGGGYAVAKSVASFYLTNQLIPMEDREWLAQELNKVCASLVRMYGNFVADASKNDLQLTFHRRW